MSPSIAVNIITLNEANNLTELLPTLDWADEIIVVDSQSNDATQQVTESFGAKVLIQPMVDYASQRNAALEMVTADWVFVIDADERLTNSIVEEIKQSIQSDEFQAYRIPRNSTIFGKQMKHGGMQTDHPIRLFKANCGTWSGLVHEELQIDGKIGRLESHLEHHSIPTLEIFMQKMKRYTNLQAQEKVHAGQPPQWKDWIRPGREFVRRMFWKLGMLDGPQGWAFAILSGWSELVLLQKHRQLWEATFQLEHASRTRSPHWLRSSSSART